MTDMQLKFVKLMHLYVRYRQHEAILSVNHDKLAISYSNKCNVVLNKILDALCILDDSDRDYCRGLWLMDSN